MAKKAAHHHDHKHEAYCFDHALEAMKLAKLKRTKSREAILKHLAENHGPFSAKELHQALNRRAKGARASSDLDTVTTYRCLASFEEAGLVRRCDFGDGVARFELRGAGDHHHHHVICVSCRKIEELADCHLEKLEEKVKSLGYTEVKHVLEFTGFCRSCRSEKK